MNLSDNTEKQDTEDVHEDTLSVSQGMYARNSIVIFFGCALAVLAYAITQTFFAGMLLQMSDDFTYSADVLSLDNFYDVDNHVFQGEQRSVTTFAYAVTGKEGDSLSVRNLFDLRTVEGEKIVAIERQYAIDPITWAHTASDSLMQRPGYLFAPIGIRKGESYVYWHVNYDTPLEMVYSGVEVVEGVETYRYQVDFSVDQTKSLHHLPHVPEKYGINLDVSLTTWIEPTTGWLVKYEDTAVAYYYDIQKQTRVHPWNTFSNRYAKTSIRHHADVAQNRRMTVQLFSLGAGWAVLMIMLGVVWKRSSARDRFRIAVAGVIVTLVVGAIIGFNKYRLHGAHELMVIGISRWVPEGNAVYDRNIAGFKQALTDAGYIEGEGVMYLDNAADSDPEKHENIIREYIKQDVDLVYSLTTPGTLAFKKRITNKPIVFSIVTYPVESGVIKTLRNSGNNLVGTRNWVPVQDQLSLFREIVPTLSRIGFIHRTGEKNSAIQLKEFQDAGALLGIEVTSINAPDLGDLKSALALSHGFDGLYSACDTLVQAEAEEVIIAFARERKIPSFSCNASGPLNGDLAGVVADFEQIGRLAGEKASLILEGVTPSALDTSTVARPFVYVNQRTADLLDITIPQTVLVKAKEVLR